MPTAYFRFYEELNDFLPNGKKKTTFPYPFIGKVSIKDAIESIGIPHIEIDLILVNGESVNFSYPLQDGDNVSVYPVFEALDISSLVQLRPKPLREIKFICDVHLGKLAKFLRLLGFDTLFDPNYQDEQIAKISTSEHRIALTRDKGLLKIPSLTHGHWVRATDPKQQLKEIVTHFDLRAKFKAFTRCLECNGELVSIDKEKVKALLSDKTSEYYHSFNQCSNCQKIYWKGSHYQKMRKFIDDIVA